MSPWLLVLVGGEIVAGTYAVRVSAHVFERKHCDRIWITCHGLPMNDLLPGG